MLRALRSLVPLLALLPPAARAIVVPTTPDSTGVYPAGGNCPIAWTLDTTDTWTSFTIELMTGPNNPMVSLEIVAAGLDGTTGPGTFSYPCPAVDINAPIYFYQFSQPGISNLTWTTRFTIASATGATVAAPDPADSVTPAPWGTGQLLDAAGASSNTGTSTGTPRSRTSTSTPLVQPTQPTDPNAGDGGATVDTATDAPAAPTGPLNTAPLYGNGAGGSSTGTGTFKPYGASASATPGAKSGALQGVAVGLSATEVLLLGLAVWVGVQMV